MLFVPCAISLFKSRLGAIYAISAIMLFLQCTLIKSRCSTIYAVSAIMLFLL